MPSRPRNHTAVIRWLLIVCLLYSGSSLEAQLEVPTPVPTQEAPSQSNGTSDDSEPKIQNYQLKHAKAAEVLKLFKELHGIKNGATVDERTNSIVFYANDEAARELRESLELLDSETPIAPPSPVVQGSSPKVPNPAKTQPAGTFRKFTFKHAKVADVLKILRELGGSTNEKDNVEGFAVDERTNSVIWKVRDEWESRHWEETLLTLDGENAASKAQKTPSPYGPADDNRSDGVSLSFQTLTISLKVDRSNTVESLKQRYNDLEQKAHQLADKLKQIKSRPTYESERSELQTAVRKSFEARQALQRAELADLAGRMKSMQQSLDMRDKLADKVVQRRVEDLLNPNLKWDAGKMSEQILVDPNQGSSNPARPLPFSTSPSSVSGSYVYGDPPELVFRKKIQGRWIVQTHSDGNKDALADSAGQVEVEIEGNSMRYLIGKQETAGPIFLTDCKELESLRLREDGPLPIDFIYDPNGDPQTFRGIIACDGTTLSICMASDEGRANKDFRPSLFVPGSKVTLIKCRRAEPETANAVSVDKATWKSRVQLATSKLLAAFPVPPAMVQNDAPKVIAIVDVDYQGKQEVGILLEEICQWIEADIPFAPLQGSYAWLSRSAVKLAMQETRLRPRDLARSSPSCIDNRQKFLNQLRSHELKVDAMLITSLKHLEDSEDRNPNQFEITLEGFIDARTTNWLERVTINGKANGKSREPLSNSLPQFETPQALLARVDESCKSGSYKDFVTLFNDDGVRDLAGSLLMSALQLTGSVDLAKNQGAETSSGTDSGVTAVSEVFKRWLPQSANAERVKAMGDGLSTMLNAIGGPSPDQSALQAFVISMRKSVEGIVDHRKFCIELMQAYEKLTTKPFVYFGNADQKNEWQISQFSDRAIATLIDGSPGMATTITLQQASGDWRISSLFNELVAEAQPITASPNATEADQSNSKMITRRYSVGSFVTDSFFVGKGNYDLKEIYEKYETDIEQSLEDLANTVTATCTQPPKFVQVLNSSRCLLIGHTEAGHQEIANLMSDIGINNDRIRLRGVGIEITKDEAKMLGIELSQQVLQQVLSSEQVEKLREFSKSRPSVLENSNDVVSFVAMDETLVSGTQRPLKINGEFPIPLTIAARIVPGSRQIQIRMDMHCLGNADAEYVAPQFQTLSDGQSVLVATLENFYWLATADIVPESTGAVYEDAEPAAKARHSSSLLSAPSD